jgi:hypothetical protein
MAFPARLLLGGMAAGAALAWYVQKQHEATGAGYLGVVRQLPAEAEQWLGRTRRRAALALEEGRAAARARDTEVIRQLDAAGASPGAGR